MNDRITIEGRDGAFGAYISRPKTLPAPAVVVLHEVFGVNADIHKTRDEPAERQSTAIRVSITPSLGTTGHTTMPQRLPSPTGGQANFHINNCGDLQRCSGRLQWLAYYQIKRHEQEYS